MENKKTCILCRKTTTTTVDRIPTAALVDLYQKRARTNTERFFSQPFIELIECKSCSLKFYWPQAVGDGKFYDELQKYGGYYLKEKSEFTEAATFVSPGDEVLEVGCGEGRFADFIKCRSYTGLEFSDEAIRKAREKGLKVLNESVESHAAANRNRYDVVCFFQVLEHVPDPHSFLQHSINCLKPGGKLLIAVPSEDSFIKEVVNFYLNMPPHHASRWPDNSLKYIQELFGIELVRISHETLNAAHRKFYVKTKIYNWLNKSFGMKFRSINTTIYSKLMYAMAVIISIMPVTGLGANAIGQSVLAVYKKSGMD